MSGDKNSQEMSFFDHLEEMRWAVLKSVVAVLIGMVACFLFSAQIVDFLIIPTKSHEVLELQFIRPSGMFMIRVYVSLGCGLVLALPVLLFQAWQFIAPGLLNNEKKYVPHVVFFSTLLFVLGASFAYYILIPILINFMLFMGSGVSEVKAQWDVGMYMSMVVKMILIMGAVFQMPILVAFLTWIRLLSPDMLKQSWRYAMVIIFILAAVITPTGDPLTQIIVAIPLLILYVLSVLISWLIARGREVEAEDEDAASANAPQPPEGPSVARSLADYTNPQSGYMGEGHQDDDEFFFEYGDEMANMPRPPQDEASSDSESGSEEDATQTGENTILPEQSEADQDEEGADKEERPGEDVRGAGPVSEEPEADTPPDDTEADSSSDTDDVNPEK